MSKMNSAIHIGPVEDHDSLDALASAMVKIMTVGGDQKTARAAIAALGKAAKVDNITLSDVHVGWGVSEEELAHLRRDAEHWREHLRRESQEFLDEMDGDE